MKIIIDATNIGGGGGVTHLKEILEPYNLEFPITIIAQKKNIRSIGGLCVFD